MTDTFDIEKTIAPVRRTMALRKLARWTLAGAGVGAAIAALILALLRINGIGPADTIFACAAIPLGAALAAVWQHPSLSEAARRLDRHFDLEDRLTTALEYRTSGEELVVLQRRQTELAVAGKPLREAAGPWMPRRELGMALLAVAVAGALFIAPAPSTSQASPTQSAELARIRKLASQQIPAITRQLPRSNFAAAQQARLVLARLRDQLRHAQTKAQALRAISEAQARLARIAAGLKPIDHSSAARLAGSLSVYVSGRHGSPESKAAKALDTIARRLSHANKQQQQRLARDLLKAANSTHDSRTRSLLHKAASAVGYKDKRRAVSALKKASHHLRQSPSARREGQSLSKTGKDLNLAKYRLSPSRIGKLQGASPDSPQSKLRRDGPNGVSPSQGKLTNRRSLGSNAAATGLNNKRNSVDSGQPGDAGGFSKGKQLDAAGQGRVKHFGVVFLPGHLNRGRFSVQLGPNGSVRHVTPSVYKHILAQYSRSAQTALDRSSLPSSLQTYVRRYFVVLSHP